MIEKKETLEKRFAESDEAIRTQVFSVLLNQPDGRKFLWWLLSQTNYGVNAFSNSDRDMAYMCGQQSVGAVVMEEIYRVAPENFGLMQMEAINEQRDRNNQLDAAPGNDDDGDRNYGYGYDSRYDY